MKRTAVADCNAQRGYTYKPLYHFIGRAQLRVMEEIAMGEDGEHIIEKMREMGKVVETMPKVYDQDGLGDQAVVHLHYFKGNMDFHITERDISDEQLQAFGFANLGHGAEMGYISIKEITTAGVELDLYWTPKTVAELRKEGTL